jgi:hypothetical protein
MQNPMALTNESKQARPHRRTLLLAFDSSKEFARPEN